MAVHLPEALGRASPFFLILSAKTQEPCCLECAALPPRTGLCLHLLPDFALREDTVTIVKKTLEKGKSPSEFFHPEMTVFPPCL
jgi:hypothetical protein